MSLFNQKIVVGIIEGKEIELSKNYCHSALLELDEISYLLADTQPSGAPSNLSYNPYFKPLHIRAIHNLARRIRDASNDNLREHLEAIRALKYDFSQNDLPNLYAYFDNQITDEYSTEAFYERLQNEGVIAFKLNDTIVYRLDGHLFTVCYFLFTDSIVSRLIANGAEGNEELALNNYKQYLKHLVEMYELYLKLVEGIRFMEAC